MRFLIRLLLVIGVLFAAGAALYSPATNYWASMNQIHYRTAEVSDGPVVWVVNSTGTVKPVETVTVGTFVSGPVKKLYVDYNDRVVKDQVMAEIDDVIYAANYKRDEATLLSRRADVQRVQAQLSLAERDQKRSENLLKENKDYISQAELDKFRYDCDALKAQLDLAKASVEAAEGSLMNSKAQLGYTRILAPVDGIVIDCKVRGGQTVAAQFQTPEMFVIAPDMETKMHVIASVDEADIGFIRDAQSRQQPVRFTVDAYPDDLFEGQIEQVRMSSTTTQNVVTYPVVVAAPNADLKLLPGMTASLSFQIQSKDHVTRIPNSALRFYPPDINQVRPEDKPLLNGELASAPSNGNGGSEDRVESIPSAMDKAEAGRTRHKRHVWVVDENNLLKAIPVECGIDDNKYTELVSGDIKVGDALVTGIQPPGM